MRDQKPKPSAPNPRREGTSNRQAGVFVILSHPDCNRRLWRLTRSADLDESSARGLTLLGIPPVGNFAPP